MGRRNRRRDEDTPLNHDLALSGVRRHSAPDGDWSVRLIGTAQAAKTYRCPGCNQEIPPGVGHIVAWPADLRGDSSDRRHWHTGCWQARDRRLPPGRR